LERLSACSPRRERFKRFIVETARRTGVDAVADETCDDVEAAQGGSIAKDAAASIPLPYIRCDPNRRQREALGIPSDDEMVTQACDAAGLDMAKRDAHLLRIERKYYPVREKFWLDQIRGHRFRSVVLVCGADHVPTFTSTLTQAGILWDLPAFDWYEDDKRQNPDD
jgi:hypothetical protein